MISPFITILLLIPSAGAFLSRLSASRSVQIRPFHMVSRRDQLVVDLLTASRKAGQVGGLAPAEVQDNVNKIALELGKAGGGERVPAKASLRGKHNLVYAASTGASSGRLFGPVSGKVTQEFLDDEKTFINTVKFGPLELSLQGDKTVKNSMTNIVNFRKTKAKIFGVTLIEKDINGGGVWKYLFMGKVRDSKGNLKLVRVIQTPALFVIEQPIKE